MTCTAHAIPGQVTPSGRPGLSGLLKREWSAFWTRSAQRATVRILRGLDDATLRDIGLSRSEIDSVVYGAPGDRRLQVDIR
ncbi:MAG TPA: DUF1127 domain-containing protein [Hyphomicrobiaceae bacterium]|nr:DUF1127 domain-containing protein [Hyphomicrobiaceae bacterium]